MNPIADLFILFAFGAVALLVLLFGAAVAAILSWLWYA